MVSPSNNEAAIWQKHLQSSPSVEIGSVVAEFISDTWNEKGVAKSENF
jgi:hypothetical protein